MKRHHYRRRDRGEKSPLELDMTTFLNLMVVLVPFLLITAVFSRITVVELSLPAKAGGAAAIEPELRVEVVVREDRLQLGDGKQWLASLGHIDGEYDLEGLSTELLALKQAHPDANAASVLLEPQIQYDHLIQVMDAVRATNRAPAPGAPVESIALFADISIGDAP